MLKIQLTLLTRFFVVSVFLLSSSVLQGTPPRYIPMELYKEYTLDGQIPVHDWYLDGTYRDPLIYKTEEIEKNLEKISRRESNYYGNTDFFLYAALEKNLNSIKNKQVAIIGSTSPWYESIILFYGGIPTTIEYNKIISLDPRLKVITVDEYKNNPCKFDAIISISTFSHDGLGRYGEPIDPNADILDMEKSKSMLVNDGLLFLGVPVGKDCLCWNAHRIYGPIRLPYLLKGWKIINHFGFEWNDFQRPFLDYNQPIFVLKPK